MLDLQHLAWAHPEEGRPEHGDRQHHRVRQSHRVPFGGPEHGQGKLRAVFDMRPGTSTQQMIGRSLLNFAVWAACDIRHNQGIARDRAQREEQEESLRSKEKSIGGECWAFGARSDSGSVDQNTQVAR